MKNAFDDFFYIGDIAILQRKTGNSSYDFNFRDLYNCRSIVSEVEKPVLLHIGAIEDYSGIELMLYKLGAKPLISKYDHLKCSRIDNWYPIIKDNTPFTKLYDVLPPLDEVLKSFSFPVFIKGDRQTNRHKKSLCIIENAEQYENLQSEWEKDSILSWQRVAIREYVPLQVIDSQSFPEMVPIRYEFRYFYYKGKCMAYGPYWSLGQQYSLPEKEVADVLKLTDWAAKKLEVAFPAIDVAKTANGEWIIIEVNDAQESGFVGINPKVLWNNTIEAMQKSKISDAGSLENTGFHL